MELELWDDGRTGERGREGNGYSKNEEFRELKENKE